jgi:hypothetical protein
VSEPNVAAKGAWGRVIWAQEGSAKNFFDGQSERDRTKLTALFGYLAGNGMLPNREKFKKVGEVNAPGEHTAHGLFEFKSFQLRFLGEFRPNHEFVIAHGLRKKKDDLDPADLTRAAVILSNEPAAKEKEK